MENLSPQALVSLVSMQASQFPTLFPMELLRQSAQSSRMQKPRAALPLAPTQTKYRSLFSSGRLFRRTCTRMATRQLSRLALTAAGTGRTLSLLHSAPQELARMDPATSATPGKRMKIRLSNKMSRVNLCSFSRSD